MAGRKSNLAELFLGKDYDVYKKLCRDPDFRSRVRSSAAFVLGVGAFCGATYLRDYVQTGGCDPVTVQVCAPLSGRCIVDLFRWPAQCSSDRLQMSCCCSEQHGFAADGGG